MTLDAQLAAISHPVRRAIVRMALSRERSAGEIADAFSISRPAVSQHVRILVAANLLRERREAQRRLYRADPAALERFRREFDGLWASGLKRLKRVIEADLPRKKS